MTGGEGGFGLRNWWFDREGGRRGKAEREGREAAKKKGSAKSSRFILP